MSPQPRRRPGFFYFMLNLPRWGLEARRRVTEGQLVKGSAKPPPSDDKVDEEGMIWLAGNHPLAFWSVTALSLLPFAFVAFCVIVVAAYR